MAVRDDLIIERGGNVTIVAANLFLLDFVARGVAPLAEAIGVVPPASWPPEHNGPEMFAWVRDQMEKHPGEPGYFTWFIIGDGMLCGTAGYKGPPDVEGKVEVGYSIVPEAQRRGFASGAVDLLIKRAFCDPRVMLVCAETLTDGIASQSVLLRCGFVAAGSRVDRDDGEVVCFERRRS